MLLRRYTCNALPELQITKTPNLHVTTLVARFQNSRSPNLYVFALHCASRPPCLQICMPTARLSSPIHLNLHINTPADVSIVSISPCFHVRTPNAHLRSSIPLHSQVNAPVTRIHTFTSTLLQRVSIPPVVTPVSSPWTFIPLYLHIATPTSSLSTSLPPRLHDYGVPPALRTSIPP